MNRTYEEMPDTKQEREYLCEPGKICAGNKDLHITINNSSHSIYFTLEEQNQHCLGCEVKSCRLACRKAIVDIFSSKSEKLGPGQLRKKRGEKRVIEANGIIIKDEKERNKALAD